MIENNKLLSIIVPSYNMEAYLLKCLGSLIIDDKELLQKLDVIVVNDGSKDRTSEIAHEFEAKYPDVFRVIDKGNGHYGSCVNAGLTAVRGQFVKILDADDSFDTKELLKFLVFLSSEKISSIDSDIDVVFTNAVSVDLFGNIINRRYCTAFQDNDAFGLDAMTSEAVETLWMHQVTYRSTVFKGLQYKQTEGVPFTDQEWIFIPMSRVRKAISLSCVLYCYLVGRDGQTINRDYYLKNFNFIREMAKRNILDLEKLMRTATKGGVDYLRKRMIARAKLVYYNYIIVFPQSPYVVEERDLIEFNRILCRNFPDVHKELCTIRLLKCVPIGYIYAWHCKSVGYPFLYWILIYFCFPLAKVKSKCLNFLRRLLYTNSN